MRATFNSSFLQSAIDLSRATSELQLRQHQVSSGRRLSSASDDPTASAGAVREHSEIAALDQYKQTADGANSRLSVVDSVLSDMLEQITSAKTTVLAAQSTNVTADQRTALANQLSGIRDALFSDYSTKFNGTFLFSGQAATVAPYQKLAGGAISSYAGTTTEMVVDIDRETTVQVSFNADEIARGADANDVFAELTAAITAVQSGNAAGMTAAGSALDRVFQRTTTAQSQTGAGLKAIESQQGRTSDLRLASLTRAEGLEQVNMAEAITKMAQADTAYKAALGAIGTAGRVTLMDYL